MSGLEQANKAITEVCEAFKTSDAIPRAIDGFREFLLAKNKAYGNSIYEPVRVFTAEPVEQLILARLNDKATRLLNGESGGEDSFDDLLGYLILRKALPIYMRSRSRRFSDDDMGIVALTYNRLCDVAGVEVAERVFLATPVGGDVVEDMQKAIEAATRDGVDLTPAYSRSLARGAVPGHIVTRSLRDRGLRVGMTYQEVRDNKWTECAAMSAEGPEPISGWCSESDPCSACKFLDGALCKCGHSWCVHDAQHCMPCSDCDAFSLASWTPDSDGLTYREEPNMVYKPVDADSQTKPIYKIGEVADVSEPKKETDMTDTNEPTTTKKPRIDRKTWYDSADGKHAIGSVLGFLSENPIVSWAIGKLTERSGLDRTNVSLALDYLIANGSAAKNGRAKGMRYAVAGFTDWPAPTPRNRKANEPPVSEADADAAHSLDASDSE